MAKEDAKHLIQNILSIAGINIDGPERWDIKVHNAELYERILRDGSLGLGESYMEGWWEVEDLDEFFYRALRTRLAQSLKKQVGLLASLSSHHWLAKIVRKLPHDKAAGAFQGAELPYQLGPQLFECMLDNSMSDTCAYWRSSETLADAQQAKLALICGKLSLRPGMRILDIGCGFGTFAKYAAQHYGVSVVALTLSTWQYEWAKQNCAGLPIEVKQEDYRNIKGNFDRVISLGMLEHISQRDYREFMCISAERLRDQGLMLVHTIGGNASTRLADPWIRKYIFPNGRVPSVMEIGQAAEDVLIMEDWHNFGVDHHRTLMAWYHNFKEHWDALKQAYDERFYRMWSYYLCSCAGAFRARELQLWQIVLSKGGLSGGYRAIR